MNESFLVHLSILALDQETSAFCTELGMKESLFDLYTLPT